MTGESTELDGACFDLARSIKWVQKPVSTDEIQGYAQKLIEVAQGFVSDGLQIDLPLLARAVRYVTAVHAMPHESDDVAWFENMLMVLLEVARPNSEVEGDGAAFLKDMLEGIETLTKEGWDGTKDWGGVR